MLRWFGGFGFAVMVCVCLLLQQAPFAFAQTTTVTFTLPPSPTPSPTPAPSPSGKAQTVRGGPLTYSLNGSLSFGEHYQSSTYGGTSTIGTPSPSASPSNPIQALAQSQSQTQAEDNAGLIAQVGRRTATTSTSLIVPVSGGSNGALLGQVNAFYSTPKYSAVYGPQQLVLFGQLPLGSTLRGFAFVVPTAFGDETLYEGPTIGAEGEILRLLGFRVRAVRGATYYELGIATGDGAATGRSRTLTFGAATTDGNLNIVGEGAWQERAGGDGSPNGPGAQVQLTDGTSDDSVQATIRHLPDQFVAYGAGEIFGDNYFDTNWHTDFGQQQLALDANVEHIGTSPTQLSSTRTESLLYSGDLSRFGGYSLSLQQLGTVGGGENQITNSAALQTSFNLGALNAMLGTQLTRSMQNLAGVIATTGYSAALQRQFGLFGTSVVFSSQRTTQSYYLSQAANADGLASGPSVQTSIGGGISRIFGKTGVSFSDTVVHSDSETSDAVQQTPLLTVSRQISPVISVQTSYGIQTLRDRLNPSSDGRSRLFTFQINAPFSYGSGITSGRIDPRMPATITGRVQMVSTGNGPLAGYATSGISGGGLANVLVTLDGKYLQRTDLTGSFQFSFVPAGQHQLRIDASSLPRGLTVDQPVATVTLQGGQVSQVLFHVGNFGGILGHVFGLDASGKPLPLPNVQVRLDGGPYSQTDTSGAFGFGGLQPGKHTVEVIENTVPAFATFDTASLKQSVSVHDGQYTKVTFSAVPLGSIAGKVIFGPEMLPEKGGVENAYVVAEPGEHAAIDEDDGTYIIDNLPPGDYTVSVDPETLPEGDGAKPESLDVKVASGAHVDGVDFAVGRFEKKVVFSFVGNNGATSSSSLVLREKRLPPRGSTEVTIDAPQAATSVTVTAFDKRQPLLYNQNRKLWIGEITVPNDAKAGDYSIAGEVAGAVAPTSTTLTVDPKVPLVIMQTTPRNPVKGQYVVVRARFLVDVRAGDKIRWDDGQVTTLGKPVSGRVFTFSLLISLRPMNGVLLTQQGSIPIQLL